MSWFMVNAPKDYNLNLVEGRPVFAVQDTTKSAVAGLTETLPYFELAGHRLERQNHGAPQCPRIVINGMWTSWSWSHAWSREKDGENHWFYNYPGACEEALFLGREIPTIDQWMEMFASVEGSAEQKAKILNIPTGGYRNEEDGKFYVTDDFSGLWSSSERDDRKNAHYVFLKQGSADAVRNYENRGVAMSLRFFAK